MRSSIRYLPIFWITRGRVAPARRESARVLDEDHADVVAAAPLVRLCDELAAARGQVGGMRGDDLGDAGIGNHVGQSVRAQQDDVARRDDPVEDLELDVLPGS